MLEKDLLLQFIKKAKEGDNKAKEIIFINNTPLIKSIIKRFTGKGIEYDDLYQIACIGFIKAIKNFDESFNVKFSTYSVPMIIGEIKRYIRDNGAIKVCRSIKILANKINRYIDNYFSENSISPSIENIAEKFNISAEEVVVALDSAKMPLSIYDKFEEDDDGQELIEKLPLDDQEDVMIDKIMLSDIIDKLNEKEKKIVIMRFFRDITQSEIAKELGVSQVQVSRLENKIIDKIRQKF